MENHETSCIKNNEYDITKHLCRQIGVLQGEYEEFVRLSFIPPKNTKAKDCKHSKLFYLNHGWGGASPVTAGSIHHHRVAEFVRADFVCMGHLHTNMVDRRIFWEVSNKGRIMEKSQYFLRTPGYKLSRKPGMTTWESVRGIKPKPRGGIWIRFSWNTTHDCLDSEIIQPAI